MSAQDRLNRIWYDGAVGATALGPFSWLYGRMVAARRAAYTSGRRPSITARAPVVVVGNLSVGGTGKTPVVAWLAWQLGALGRKVGIASRGYGAIRPGTQQVHGSADWRAFGDEPVLLQRRTAVPVVVDPDRVAAAQRLVELGADIILCDDGLQHLPLARNFEIAVIDGARGLGNGRLLPAGPLREPAARLGGVDAVILNGEPRAGLLETLLRVGAPTPLSMRLVPSAIEPVRSTRGGATLADELAAQGGGGGAGAALWGQRLEDLQGVRVHAVAGIGNPRRFFRLLESYGLEVVPHPFADHHPFSARDLDLPGELPILMTEKDAVRCAAFASDRLACVPVTAQFSLEDAHSLLVAVSSRCAKV
ncbi:MAG TPA: tetraacyldisaccharide 4'-kinase [Steroidobacteraceae bacterium]|nr:tetraacyldisaccharide 4'-kinase [Steroidobacteraceae bacterium]